MAQIKVYGNTIGHWKAEYTLNTSFSNTSATIQIQNAGFRSTGWGFQLTGLGYNVCIKDDHTTNPPAGNVSLGTGSDDIAVFVSEKSLTINKTHSEQKIYTGIWIGNYTSYESGESYGEYYVTVPAKPSYTVTYNANGGSGAPSTQTKWYGENLTLSSTKPTRSGYVFVRWNTKTSNDGTTYSPGATYSGNSALTLYAIWQQVLTISYNANSHGTAPKATTINKGTAITLGSIAATGYRFDGWYTAASGGTRRGGIGDKYTPTASETLYAHWTQFWTLSYNANGGSGAPSSQTKYANTALTLSNTKPTRNGYNFLGWATSNTATSATYQPGGPYPANATGNVTLYAVWKVAYIPPSITSIKAFRTTTQYNTSAIPSGNKITIMFNWAVDRTATSNNVIKSGGITVKYKLKTDSAYSSNATIQTQPATTAYSGSIVASIDAPTSNSYDFQINVQDNTGNSASTTTKYISVGPALVPLDIQNQGKRIGIMSAAPTVDNTIELGGRLEAPIRSVSYIQGATGQAALYQPKTQNTDQWAPVFTTRTKGDSTNGCGAWSVGNYNNEKLQFVYFTPERCKAGTNGTDIIITMEPTGMYVPQNFSAGSKIQAPRGVFTSTQDASGTADNNPALIVGTQTGEHLEFDSNEIMSKATGTTTAPLYINTDGGLVEVGTGGFRTKSQIEMRATNLTHGTTPSENTNSARIFINDNAADEIASFNARFLTDGREGFEIRTSKLVSGESSRIYNAISAYIDQSGNRSYSVSDSSAFRSAIYLDNTGSLSGTNAFTVNTSNATLTAAYIRYNYAKVCTIYVKVKLKAALNAGSTRVIGSIVTGYYPPFDFRLNFGGITGMTGLINSSGTITVGNSTGAQLAANSEFYCTGTYVFL